MSNWSLFPKEAFESMANVANNLIEKISLATGYLVTPKGKRKDMEEAVAYFINEIKNNDLMTDLSKAACISNARKMIREYCNQNDILHIAISNLNDKSNPDLIKDDWLVDFWEKAGCVNDEDIKLIFGKILSNACNDENMRFSKALIHKLYLMDGKIAKALQKLKQYAVRLEAIDINGNIVDEDYNVFYFNNFDEWENKYPQKGLELIELEAAGIINKNDSYVIGMENQDDVGESKIIKEIKIFYSDSYISLTGDEKGDFQKFDTPIYVDAGTICLTRDGKFLLRIIENSQYLEGYMDDMKSIFKTMGYKVQ